MSATPIQTAAAGTGLTDELTIEQGTLRLAQRVHAVLIIIIPFLGLVAALALAVLHGVTLLDISLLIGMFVITILGITAGFHRHFSHRSFKAVTPVRVALGVMGSMAAQGSVSYWVSNHRRHHQYTDKPGDIHSPYVSSVDSSPITGFWNQFWHSHTGWTFGHRLTNPLLFAPDIYKSRAVAFVNQTYYLWVIVGLALPAAIGGLVTQTWYGALTGFLWGGLARLFFTYHAVNAIDSVTHLFGWQDYDTHDHSRNNVWMVLPTLGEGWHNNHHAQPGCAYFSRRWWQFDPGGIVIRALEATGLAWDVRRPSDKEANTVEGHTPVSTGN